jgi:hypothetical protein
MDMTNAIEVTTFRLSAGVTMDDFLNANADVDAWLAQQPGFKWRRICEREDGYIVDVLLWAAAEDGRRAASAIMTELAHSPVHAAIDQSTVDWSISTQRSRVTMATNPI